MGNEFIKEISEMNLEQITERKAELETEIRSAESKESLEGMEEKINAINTRIAELKEFETRKAQAEALQNNVVVPDKTIEETRKEEGKMNDQQLPIENLMLTAMNSIKDMVDVNTIIGEPIETSNNTIIIPISKVGFGFAAGGSEFKGETIDEYTKREKEEAIQYRLPFGGGS